MCSLETFKIDLKGLPVGETTLEYSLGDDYFEAIEGPEVRSGALHVSVAIRRQTGFFELLFHTQGTVRIPCDLCLDDMEQPIEADNRLVAKFGEADIEDDEVVMVSEDEGILDLSWLIYEFIALAISENGRIRMTNCSRPVQAECGCRVHVKNSRTLKT